MGEHLTNINLPIGLVVSSVSCRARQTAVLAFGGYDSLHRILVYKGPYNETKKHRVASLVEIFITTYQSLRKLILSFPPKMA